jgi:uncharacterized membrane protein
MTRLLQAVQNRHWTHRALIIAVVSWIVLFAQLVMRRHNTFGTFDFDLGIHDQSLWLLAHGKTFNTVCGLPVFGHHAMFMYYFLVPFVWIGGGPNLWNVFQVIAVGMAAVPVFYIALFRLKSTIAALVFAVAWLLLPTTGFLIWETFHPETMAIPFLFTGYYYAISRNIDYSGRVSRTSLAFIWLSAAVLWKEDIALAVIGIGVLMLWKKQWRFGFTLIGASSAYFLIIGVWLVPTLAGEFSAYGALYGDLGTTPLDVVTTSLSHPSRFFNRLSDNNALGYIGQIASPFAFMSLLAPITLLMAVPQYFINILTTADFTWSMMYHYQVVPIVGAMVAAIDGVAFVQRRSRVISHMCITAVLIASCTAAVQWGNSPIGDKQDYISWGRDTPWIEGWKAAHRRVGPDDIVSAHYALIPHITHREVVYSFPNPWIRSNFLNSPDRFVNPDRVKWIVVPETQMAPEVTAKLNELIASGEFGDAQTVNNVTSYRRLKPSGIDK